MTVAGAVLEVNNIEVIYNKAVQVLHGLSLTVKQGEIVALLGSNGAGKTTTLRAVSGLLRLENGEVTRGSIRYAGGDTAPLRPHQLVRGGLFHVMEGRQVFQDLSVEDNLIAATYALSGRSDRAQPDFALVYEYFPRLHERRKILAGYLSGGEQQMLAIGRALLARPTLMLLDEPSLGLSPRLVEEMFALIQEISRQGLAILLMEQNAVQTLAIANRAYIIENGRVAMQGKASDLARDPALRKNYLGL